VSTPTAAELDELRAAVIAHLNNANRDDTIVDNLAMAAAYAIDAYVTLVAEPDPETYAAVTIAAHADEPDEQHLAIAVLAAIVNDLQKATARQ
jgi:hypothetical protein